MRFIILLKCKIASISDIINLDAFDNDISASSQQTAEVTKELGVKNRASQESEANLALYSSSFSQRTVLTLQGPSNNTFTERDIFFWGYDCTFGHFPLDSTLVQLSYHQPPYPAHASLSPWYLTSSTPAPLTSITPASWTFSPP